MRDCAMACGADMEIRKVRSNEVPVILGTLVSALAKQTGMPLATVCEVVIKSAETIYKNTP